MASRLTFGTRTHVFILLTNSASAVDYDSFRNKKAPRCADESARRCLGYFRAPPEDVRSEKPIVCDRAENSIARSFPVSSDREPRPRQPTEKDPLERLE